MRVGAMKLAISNVARWGDTDIFPKPLDNHVLAGRPAEFERLLRSLESDDKQQLARHPPAVIKSATPVGYVGYRWGTQIDPLWNAYLLGAVLDLADQIEAVRVGPDWVCSHRFAAEAGNARLFDEDGYSNFVRRSRELAHDHNHVVVTDIADFYGRVSHHRLENVLLALPRQGGLAKRIVKLLGSISGGRSYGLPVGGPAARLLAEILLDRVDRAMLATRIKFVRFADDYRLFANSEDEAQGHLATLSDLLSTHEGLALQKAKTRVMTAAEYLATIDSPSPHGTKLSGVELKARQLLNFSLRFDPYSPDPEGDYERLEAAVDQLDIVDLFSTELSKSRVDPQFTKKLLKAVQFAQSDVKSAVAESLCLNLPLLAPVFPQVMGAVKGLWTDLAEDARLAVGRSLVELCDSNSYLLRAGVSRAYAVRVLAEMSDQDSESALVGMFNDKNSDAGVRRDVILAMANRGSLWWLSGLLQDFGNLNSPAERRAFLAASFVMTEEADFFRRRVSKSLSPLENLTVSWAADSLAVDSNWKPPI